MGTAAAQTLIFSLVVGVSRHRTDRCAGADRARGDVMPPVRRRWPRLAALVLVVVVALVPIGYLVSLSVRPPAECAELQPATHRPDDVRTSPRCSTPSRWARCCRILGLSAVGAAVLAVVIATPAAYFTAPGAFAVNGCSRRCWQAIAHRRCVAIIPLFFLLRDVGLTNNVAGLIPTSTASPTCPSRPGCSTGSSGASPSRSTKRR